MQLDIVTIGNSQGIRLPKALLAQCGFDKQVEVVIENEKMILSKPVNQERKRRAGWSDAINNAKTAVKPHDDTLISVSNKWDEAEWEW